MRYRRPGIGIKLTDDTVPEDQIAAMHELAAQYKAREAIEAAQSRAAHEAAESARVITDAPLFYWNGIKDAKGDKLQKAHYSMGQLRNHPEGSITIYARDYCRFSSKVNACFAVQNDSDMMVDYFESDRIRVIPAHPLYTAVKAAYDAQQEIGRAHV